MYPAVAPVRVPSNDKADLLVLSYIHLTFGVAIFAAAEAFWFQTGIAQPLARFMLRINWLWVLAAFSLVAFLAVRLVECRHSKLFQYSGFLAYLLLESIIFIPLIYQAERMAPGVLYNAAPIALAGFAVLSSIVLITGSNFSFLRGFLLWAGFLAIFLIVLQCFGFLCLGTGFSLAMIGYAGLSILYDTSYAIHEAKPGDHLIVATMLFSSAALMFWYVIRYLAESGSGSWLADIFGSIDF